MVNGVVARNWKSLTGGLTSGSTSQFVKAPPLKNMLKALTKTCANNMGLLRAAGYRNILDVDAVVNSQSVKDGCGKLCIVYICNISTNI